MASALITLTTAGTGTGPFDLYSNVNSYATPFETGVAKSSLVSGYTSSLVPNGTTIIRVQSTSVQCPNYVDISVSGITTSTTTTSTTTPPLVNAGSIINYSSNTISSSYVTISINGSTKASFTLPPLAPGGTFNFSTSYTTIVYGGTWEVRFYPTSSGVSSSNYFNMTAGSSTTDGYFTNFGSYWGASVTSSGAQYVVGINFRD